MPDPLVLTISMLFAALAPARGQLDSGIVASPDPLLDILDAIQLMAGDPEVAPAQIALTCEAIEEALLPIKLEAETLAHDEQALRAQLRRQHALRGRRSSRGVLDEAPDAGPPPIVWSPRRIRADFCGHLDFALCYARHACFATGNLPVWEELTKCGGSISMALYAANHTA